MTNTPSRIDPLGLLDRPQAPRRRRGLVITLSVAAAAALAVAAGVTAYVLAGEGQPVQQAAGAPLSAPTATAPAASPSASPAVFTFAGAQVLGHGHTGSPQCTGEGGYHDIKGGANVFLYKASSSEPVARGKLDPGLVDGTKCVFQFIVRDVPNDQGPYQILVGGHFGPTLDVVDLSRGSVVLELP